MFKIFILNTFINLKCLAQVKKYGNKIFFEKIMKKNCKLNILNIKLYYKLTYSIS